MINIKNLNLSFKDETIIKDLTVHFKKNRVSVILGPSGSGKSSLFKIISKIIEPTSGEVIRNFKDLSFIFQEDRLLPWDTTLENLKLVTDKSMKEIDEVLDILNLKEKKHQQVKSLSGGEKQRVSIARGFLFNSDLILLDESLKSLDLSLKIEIIRKLSLLTKKYSKTLLIISHDIDEALLMGEEIFIFSKKPLSSFKKIDIELPFEERNLDSTKLHEYKKKILSYLL